MSRSFGTRLIRGIESMINPETMHDSVPENETVTGAENHPTQGDPSRGIPSYPNPLPAGHDYRGKEVTVPERLNVPPNKPYYAGGMAHGVRSPEHYDGRIAPHDYQRRSQEAEREDIPHIGSYKLEPIPVYVTEPGAGVHPLTRASFRQVTIKLGADPVPIADRNTARTRIRFLVESATGGIRLRTGPTNDTGAYLPAGTNRYESFESQDEIWAVVDSSANADQVVSVIDEFKIAR